MNNNRKNTSYNDDTGEIISWIVVFIFMFAFWPIGLVLLVKRLHNQSKKPAVGSKTTDAKSNSPAFRDSAAMNSQKRQRNPLEKKSGKFTATILLLISIALFIFGANTIYGASRDVLDGAAIRWPEFCLGVFYFIGGFIIFLIRNLGVRRFGRYKKYYAFVDGRDIVRISDIAQAAGHSGRAITRDIQAMIISGYFGPGAYLDKGLDSLVLSSDAAYRARRATEAAESPPQTPVEKPENQYMAVIIELRELNATIQDLVISDKIDRIEELTAKIFRIVEDDPAKLPQIRRFMNYYLPTTLKLLYSYATLEKQGIKGENIVSAKENIGRILDTLATGFEQQLDQLFKKDVIDIAADINVLENMMKQDGLTNSQFEAGI